MEGTDTDIAKILLGALVGWSLTQIAALVIRRSSTQSALWLLEGELGTVRSQLHFASQLLEEQPAASKALLALLPQITIYRERFDDLSRALPEKEMYIAKNVVSYYNSMRRAFPEQVPDISGIASLETIVSSRRKLRRFLAYVFYPKVSRKANSELKNSVKSWYSRLKGHENNA